MILSSNLHSKTLLEKPLALHGDITDRVSWGVVMEGDHVNDNVQATNNSRKIMVVADSTRESTGALQYALSHAIHENDELILLHVEPPNTWKFTFSTLLRIKPNYLPILTLVVGSNNVASINEGGNTLEGDNIDFLEEMKQTCKNAQPKIHVRVERVTQLDGKDKAATILAQTIELGVDILVTGQRRNTFATTLLGYKAGGSTKGAKPIDTAEYLIENSKCTCVAVQKRGQNAGYLLNTKTHKNFWLLA